MKIHNGFLIFVSFGLVISGCGGSHPPLEPATASDVAKGKSVPVQAEWTEEEGLLLPEAMQQHIGLKTSPVEKRFFKAKTALDFQVFREARERSSSFYSQGMAYATIRVPVSSDLKIGEKIDFYSGGFNGSGQVVQIFEIPPRGSMQSEVLVAIPDPQNELRIAQFLQVSVQSSSLEMNFVVPESAVISTPEGTFAYRKEGERYKRTSVEIKAASDGWHPVNKGLEEGDLVVISPVKTLWLTELQLRSENSAP